MKRITGIACLLLFAGTLFGQRTLQEAKSNTEKTWVFFADKGPDAEAQLACVSAHFAPAARQRRAQRGIAWDMRDLPVFAGYVGELRSAGVPVIADSRWLNATVIEGRFELSQLQAICPAIVRTEPVRQMQPTSYTSPHAQPPQPYLPKTNSVIDYGQNRFQVEMMGLDYLHDNGFTGSGVNVAVFDAGFFGVDTTAAYDSVWANNQIQIWYDFVADDTLVFQENFHGAMVFSLLGANMPGDFVGTAPHANYIFARTEEVAFERNVEEYNWLEAMEWADSIGVDIIQNSLGYGEFDAGETSYSYSDMDGNTTTITQAADIAASRGILVVSSAGNEGGSSWLRILAPCDGDSVLCVGAVDGLKQHAAFSSYGPSADGRIKPDVVTWGEGVTLIGPVGNIGFSNGTSFSAPQISGLAACLIQAHPDRSNMEILHAIQESADRYQNPDSAYGYGIPNARAADSLLSLLDSLASALAPGADLLAGVEMYPNPAENRVHIRFADLQRDLARIEILDVEGRRVFFREVRPGMDQIEIDVTGWAAGVYGVRFIDGEGGVAARKLVVQPH